jgi:hypothetical protein
VSADKKSEGDGKFWRSLKKKSKQNNQLLLLLLLLLPLFSLCDVKKVAALCVNIIIIMICNPTLFIIIVVVVVVIDTVGVQLGELLHNLHALVFVFLLRLQLVLALVPLQTRVVE